MKSIPGRRFRGIAGTRHRQSVAALLFVIILTGCSHKEADRDWQAMVAPVRARYAPDPRLAVFHAEIRADKDGVFASGEVEGDTAKRELLKLLRQTATGPIADEIKVLPDSALGSRNSGLVNVSVGNVRREPDHAAELVTQVLLGDTVELLKKNGGWNYIHCPDRYLGWIDEEALLAVDAAAVTAWNSADLYRVVRQYELLRSEPRADAAPDYDEWHARAFVPARRFVAQ